jgi:hypothetical protein
MEYICKNTKVNVHVTSLLNLLNESSVLERTCLLWHPSKQDDGTRYAYIPTPNHCPHRGQSNRSGERENRAPMLINSSPDDKTRTARVPYIPPWHRPPICLTDKLGTVPRSVSLTSLALSPISFTESRTVVCLVMSRQSCKPSQTIQSNSPLTPPLSYNTK